MRFIAVCLILLAAHTKILGDNFCPGLRKCTCNKDRTSVNCEGKHFTSIPKFPDTTETLYLAQNDFINIPSRSFTGLPNLRTLFLDHNKITSIDPFAFEGLQSLTHLDLRRNEITALVNNSLANIPRLSKLYLSTNKIQSIAVDSFNGTSTLEHINLQSNYLTAIPLLVHQPYLKQVTLDGNRIVDATFPSSHLSCSRKMSIVLSNNDITALTNSTFLTLANTSLSKLYLSSNNIKSVEAGTFSGLNSILSLKLGSNPLDSLSLKQAVAGLAGKTINSLDISGIALAGLLMKDTFSLLQNTSLESLIMRFNAINVVRDNSFSRLKSLTMLDLSQSQITRAEKDAFNGLDQVSTLKLNKNRFVTIPEKLPPSLLFLYLGSNQIRKIPANIFNNLVQLQELRMGNNNILTLETGAFNGLVNLKILYLYNNYIATLPGTIFSPFVRLKKLDLGKNNLKTIQVAKDRFSSLLSLYYLNLADNKCTFLQSDIFKSMKSLKYLHLERNNLGQLIAGQYDGQLFKGLTKLRHIHIMSNNIEYLPSSTFKDQLFLTLLNVSHNSLSNWEPNLFKSTRKLSTFDISFNLITTVKQENFQDLESLQYLNMTGSPFLCNCDLRWFRDWINTRKTKVSNNASYTCYGPNGWRSKPLLEFSRKKIDCLFFSKYAIIGAVLGGLVMALLSGVLVYKNRWRLRLRWYRLSRRGQRFFGMAKVHDIRGNYGAIEGTSTYDAYVSCSDMDTHWALQNLLPGIDNGRLDEEFGGTFRLYYEDRDSNPSASMVANIVENMTRSRKVIVVLSMTYLNGMNEFELDTATTLLHDHDIEDIIVIKLGDVPAKRVPNHLYRQMRYGMFIEWEDTVDAKETFLVKLRERLQRRIENDNV